MTDRPKIMLPAEVEAWYDKVLPLSREYIDKATARVIETAKAKGVGGDAD